MTNWNVDEVIKALEEIKNNERGAMSKLIEPKYFIDNNTQCIKTIIAKVADGIGKPVGEIRIDMITEIVNEGRAGIVPKTYFEVWERTVKINTFDILEDALNDYNRRTGEWRLNLSK